jgi:hypothetical protein
MKRYDKIITYLINLVKDLNLNKNTINIMPQLLLLSKKFKIKGYINYLQNDTYNLNVDDLAKIYDLVYNIVIKLKRKRNKKSVTTLQSADSKNVFQSDSKIVFQLDSEFILDYSFGFCSQFNPEFNFQFSPDVGSGYNLENIKFDISRKKKEYYKHINKLELKRISPFSKLNNKLNGIDKICIINMLGSKRKDYMLGQLQKIGLDDTDYEFINPINFKIDDITIDEIIKRGIIPKNINFLSKELKKGDSINVGTLSLSIITYYLFLKAAHERINILIIEDNIEFENDFLKNYNEFFNKIPDNIDWQILDLHSFNEISYKDSMCKIYYEKLKKEFSNITIPNVISDDAIINNDTRAVLNDKVTIGCNEGSGAKAYVIKPTSFLFINFIPIIFPVDGIKNWISGYWNESISLVPKIKLIGYKNMASSDRRSIDNGDLLHTFVKLDKKYINNILDKVQNFNKEKNKYITKLIYFYNKNDLRTQLILKDVPSKCINFSLDFKYFNINDQLCQERNINARILETYIKQFYINFKIKDHYKFNPSIINLNNSYMLMSYRIYIGKIDDINYHPWDTFWESSIYTSSIKCKLNFTGLCLINKVNMKVEKDTLLFMDDGVLGLEDARLFENNNKIYVTGAITTGEVNQSDNTWNDNRIMRQCIGELGTRGELLDNLPFHKIQLKINCIKAHGKTNIIEKNWFGYNDDNNEHIIINPTYIHFLPLQLFKVNLENKESINEKSFAVNSRPKSNLILSINNALTCSKLYNINETDLIKNLNNKYKNYSSNNEQIFRLSGGSWGINYNDEILFIGHLVVYVSNFDIDKVNDEIKMNPNNLISINLIHLIFNRPKQLTFFQKTTRYYNVFFTIKNNKLNRISHAFNIFSDKYSDTSVNFPTGLINTNNHEFFISFGESDSKCILMKISKNDIDKLFNETDNPLKYKFMTFDSSTQLLCYTHNKIYKIKY